MMARRIVLAALFASVSLVSLGAAEGSAAANPCDGTLINTCINDDTLWPHAGPARFLGVGSVETVGAGQIGFGLVTSYLSRPLVLSSSSPGPTTIGGALGQNQNVVDNQVNGSFLWAYGVTKRLELDFILPITFAQSGAGAQPVTGGASLNTTAVRDLRFGAAYALVPRARIEPTSPQPLFGLLARFEASAPSGDQSQFAGERTAVAIPSISADFRYRKWFAGAELGARIRPVTEFVGARIGTEGVVALGVGYDILPHELLSAMVEARALPNFVEQNKVQVTPEGILSTPGGNYIAPAEWTTSVRMAPLPGGDFSLQLGGGGALPFTSDATTEPRFRFTLSIRYAPLKREDRPAPSNGPACTPGGAGPDACPPSAPAPSEHARWPGFTPPLTPAGDRCRDEPDAADGFRTDDGCPDEDSDKDGIPDRLDKCPLEAEDFAGLGEGCPGTKGP